MRCPLCNKIIVMSNMGIRQHYRYSHPADSVPDVSVPLCHKRYDEVDTYVIEGAIRGQAVKRSKKNARFTIPGL